MNYVIQKNIPIPTKRKVNGKWMKKAKELEVGDSMWVETTKVNSLLSAMRKLGFKSYSEAECSTQVGEGRRVWRTA